MKILSAFLVVSHAAVAVWGQTRQNSTFQLNVAGNTPTTLTALDTSNFVVCVELIKDVMSTGGSQPGMELAASHAYLTTNPGPYPFVYTLGSDPASSTDDTRLVHPFLPVATVAETLAGVNGTDAEKALYAQGFQNASDLAQSTCCGGDLFGFGLPFLQDESNEDGSVGLGENLRWYVAMAGKANQSEATFYTACPYTSVPVNPRVNTNFPDDQGSSSARSVHGRFALLCFTLIVATLA